MIGQFLGVGLRRPSQLGCSAWPDIGNDGRRRFGIPFGRNCPRTVRHDGGLVGMAGSSSRFKVITVGSHIGAPGRVRGALAPAAGCALWYLLTEPVAGHHCAPSGQRALLLGCQRAWAGARHIRGPADRPRGRVGLRYPSRPAESGGNSQTQCGERQTQVPHYGVPFSSRWTGTLHRPGDNSAGLLRQHFTCRRRVLAGRDQRRAVLYSGSPSRAGVGRA